MPIFRPLIKASNNVGGVLKNGWGMLESYSPTNLAATNQTITAAMIQGALIIGAPTAAANYTLDTGANLDIAFSDADIGDEWDIQISNQSAFAITIVTAAGITLTGNTTIPANSCRQVRFVRTGVGAWAVQAL